MAVDVKVSIKGTWLFNEDFPQPSNAGAREVVDFFVTINGVVHQGSAFSYDGAHWVYTTDIGDVFAYTFGEGWNKDLGEDIRRVTFAEGEDVRESFVRWMNRSAKPEFATVAYKGEALATVFGEQTVTLKCEGMKMEGDLEIRAAECGYTEGYETGKQAERDTFWDIYQDKGKRDNYRFAFAGKGWTAENFKPKYDIKPMNTYAYMMFQQSNISGDLVQMCEDCGVKMDFSGLNGWAQNLFTEAPITRLGVLDFRKVTVMSGTFAYCYMLVTIDELIVSENTEIGTSFTECDVLENLKISGVIGKGSPTFQWSTKLTKASITSIINALSATKSGLTVTLSKVAVDNAFETSEGHLGSNSDEWLNLIATKSNWTISLV